MDRVAPVKWAPVGQTLEARDKWQPLLGQAWETRDEWQPIQGRALGAPGQVRRQPWAKPASFAISSCSWKQ